MTASLKKSGSAAMTNVEYRTAVRKAAFECPLTDPVERFVYAIEWARSHPPPETLYMASCLREVVKSDLIKYELEYSIESAIEKHVERLDKKSANI